jgi:hypothetical protein
MLESVACSVVVLNSRRRYTHTFSIHSVLQQGEDLSLLLFKFASAYGIREITAK